MKRTGFSVFLVRSARYGKTLNVSHAAHMALVTRADTSPELGHYDLGTPAYEFMFKGKSHLTKVPLSGLRKDGRRVFWDVAQHRYSAKGEFALSVRRERALLEGAEYIIFEGDVLGDDYVEAKNRKTAQAYLFQARDRETHEEEASCLMELLHGVRTLQALTERLGVPLTVITVAVIRLWMKGRVVVPMTTELLQPSWPVRRSDVVA